MFQGRIRLDPRYRIFSGPTEVLVARALEASLHEPYASELEGELTKAQRRPKGRVAVLATYCDVPVGIALAVLTRQIQVFMHPDHRGLGIGGKLIDCLVEVSGRPRSEYWADWGNETRASERFWHRCQIVLPVSKYPTSA